MRPSSFVPRTFRFVALLSASLVVAAATSALAHDHHDVRMLGACRQDTFRHGLHGMGPGLGETAPTGGNGVTDEAIQTDPPDVGGDLTGPGPANSGIGGLGQMRGTSFGNYGAGSVGQPGPGGLGSLRTGGIGQPVQPGSLRTGGVGQPVRPH